MQIKHVFDFLLAAEKGHIEVVKVFMEKLVDNNLIGGRNGLTPLQISEEEGHMEIYEYISKKNENKYPQNKAD